jgi:hypothetical protein
MKQYHNIAYIAGTTFHFNPKGVESLSNGKLVVRAVDSNYVTALVCVHAVVDVTAVWLCQCSSQFQCVTAVVDHRCLVLAFHMCFVYCFALSVRSRVRCY